MTQAFLAAGVVMCGEGSHESMNRLLLCAIQFLASCMYVDEL